MWPSSTGRTERPSSTNALEIAPEKFTLESDRDETRYYTTLDVDLQIRDAEGRLMATDLNQPLLQLSASDFQKAHGSPFGYRDNYPVLPGGSAGIRAPDTSLLNAVGDCYERLGDNAKAREYYERLLELNPQQGGVKVRLEGLDSAGSGSP